MLVVIVFVLGATSIIYGRLAHIPLFWNEQFLWSVGLIICWTIVAAGYFNQGWMVYMARSASHVSIALPIAVFFVQCILFVKGVHYHDWALVAGAVMVNSGVTFSLYQIVRARRLYRKR